MIYELKNISAGYPHHKVLDDVNFQISTGEIVCILGKNGAGKTTLFKTMLGVLTPLSGSVLLDGKNVTGWHRSDFARRVAYIPQARSLPFPYSVLDVVLFGRTSHLSMFGTPGRKDKLLAEECMDLLNIRHLQNRIFTHLSGGEQQMVIIARALAQQPSFLIMDEPTSSLDFGNQIKIIKQVNELKNNELGIVMATHLPDHAFMCDANVSVVHEGKILTSGHANDIVTETMLKEIYGVKVRVKNLGNQQDCNRKVCIPMLK